jgi:hypothetical protein
MNAITVTLAEIKQAQPCISGWRKVLGANGGPESDYYRKQISVSSIIDSNGLQDAFWVVVECARIAKDHSMLWRKFSWWMVSQLITDDTDEDLKYCLEVIERYCNLQSYKKELRYVHARIGDKLDNRTVCDAKWHLYRAAAFASADKADPWSCSCECGLSYKNQSCVGISYANTFDRMIACDKAEKKCMSIHEKKFRAILDLGRWED